MFMDMYVYGYVYVYGYMFMDIPLVGTVYLEIVSPVVVLVSNEWNITTILKINYFCYINIDISKKKLEDNNIRKTFGHLYKCLHTFFISGPLDQIV